MFDVTGNLLLGRRVVPVCLLKLPLSPVVWKCECREELIDEV